MKWITRERVKVDRVACPWLIRKFIDPDAEFLFVPADQVMAVAERENAVPYDVKDVELGHHGKECSFDAVVKKYGKRPDLLAFVAGVTAAAIGAITGAVIVLAERSIVDLLTALMALVTIGLIWKVKKLPEPVLVAVAAIIGLVAFPGVRP